MPKRGLTKKIKLAVDGDRDNGFANRCGMMTDSPAAHPYSTADPVNETPCSLHKLFCFLRSVTKTVLTFASSPTPSFISESIKGSLNSPLGILKAEFFDRNGRPLPPALLPGDSMICSESQALLMSLR